MRRISFFLGMILLSSFILHPSSFLLAQSFTDSLVGGATLIPGTTYYYPDGRQSNDSAWIKLGNAIPWYPLTLFIKQDTTVAVGVYLRPTDFPCSVRVSVLAGTRLDTLAYQGYQWRKTYYSSLDSSAERIASTTDSTSLNYTSVKNTTTAENSFVLFNDAINGVAPMDTNYFVPFPDVCRFDKFRLKVTVTDTMNLWLYVSGRR